MATNRCYSARDISALNGSIIENQDGTVSVYIPDNLGNLAPVVLNKQCCTLLNSNYVFDVENQTCLWTTEDLKTCDINEVFKIVLNPQGNDGVILNFGSNDNCVLEVKFDYLFKVKCETLNEILLNGANTDYSDINPELNNQINNLEASIEQQIVNCETITNQILLLEEQIANTPYSVFCNLGESRNRLPKTTERVVSNKLSLFEKTGFGLTSDSSKSLQSDNPIDNLPEFGSEILNFCFINDEGLSAWAGIIGSTNYKDFINGIETSYTCNDIATLINVNEQSILNGNGPLIVECNTPFGTKTNLITQLEVLNANLIICQNTLTDLQNELSILQETYNEELTNSCIRPIDMFESLDLTMTLDVLSGSTYQTVYEATDFFPQIGFGSLYEYLVNNQNSGFYVCGGSDCTPMYLNLTGLPQSNTNICQSVVDSLVQSLFEESGLSNTTTDLEIFNNSISNSAFTSSWLSHQTIISGDTILSAITDNKIRIGFKINYICDDICILVDNIQLNKVCTNVEKTNIFVSRSPGFELDRIIDNKKSWLKNTSLVNRDFEILNNKNLNPIRQTNYNVEEERLVINTKEIDLDINLASAISTDVWNYISDNPCILTGFEFCDPCDECGNKSFQDDFCFDFMDGEPYEFMDDDFIGAPTSGCCGDNLIEFDKILSTSLSSITVVEDFEYTISSELIDAKNRQTISSYPTLKALYHRYINSFDYCDTNSSAFNYQTMDQFANLVGDYWVDLIEQVIPSTTIWGSVKIYSNTIFDQQKFKYKSYSSLLCSNPFSGILVSNPINGTTGKTQNVEVIMTNLNVSPNNKVFSTTCNQLHIAQMNHGSEFIGTVNILGGNDEKDCDTQETAIDECTLQLSVDIDGVTVTPNVIGAKAPVTYLWSNGETGSTTSFPSGGTQSLTVTDSNCCTATVTFFVDHLTACWYTLPDSNFFLSSGIFNPSFGITGYTYIMENLIVNGTEYVTGPEPTYVLNDSNLVLIPTNDGDLTYTNFVTFLNQTFNSLGLNDYSAQISLNNDAIRPPQLSEKYNGFYIIRPIVDTFTINIREDDNFDTSYTENSATEPIGLDYTKYRACVCENITTQNGIVIE